jgi:hypothetical protein
VPELCGTNVPISTLVGYLENKLKIPGVDKTGLEGNACRSGQRFSPEGTSENSPAFQRWDSNPKASQVPKGRKNRAAIMCFCRP